MKLIELDALVAEIEKRIIFKAYMPALPLSFNRKLNTRIGTC